MKLNDDLLDGVKENFYLDSRNPSEIAQIFNSGSQTCQVNIFDRRSGNYIRESTIRTEERDFYKRISIENLPFSLREIYKQKLEQLAQDSACLAAESLQDDCEEPIPYDRPDGIKQQ